MVTLKIIIDEQILDEMTADRLKLITIDQSSTQIYQQTIILKEKIQEEITITLQN